MQSLDNPYQEADPTFPRRPIFHSIQVPKYWHDRYNAVPTPPGMYLFSPLGVHSSSKKNPGRRPSVFQDSGDSALDLPKGPPKILIADDNLQNVELLEAYLSDVDCEIRTAFDGEDTLRVVQEFEPDLLLLDVMMPRLSGFEVCRKLRANPATKELLILMVTALNEASDFERGVQSGTDDFLTKPVNKVELLCRIKSLLRVRHLKNQLERTLAYLAEFESAIRES